MYYYYYYYYYYLGGPVQVWYWPKSNAKAMPRTRWSASQATTARCSAIMVRAPAASVGARLPSRALSAFARHFDIAVRWLIECITHRTGCLNPPLSGDVDKSKPWEGSAHVPLMCSGPGIKAGQTVTRPVATMDMSGTFMDFASAVPAPGALGHMRVRSSKCKVQSNPLFRAVTELAMPARATDSA